MQIGLCGFSGAGRSTLFSALSGLTPTPPSGNPLIHKSTGVVRVPDPRMEWLREHFQPKKYTPATVEFVDFAGIPKGDEKGKPELFARMRDMDTLCLVVSAFPGAADATERPGEPGARLAALEEEFLFADLEIVERRIERLQATLKKGVTKTKERDEREIDLMERCRKALEANESLEAIARGKEDSEFLSTYKFLRQKPHLAVVNASEGQDLAALAAAAGKSFAGPVFAVYGSIEAEIARMPEAERAAFLAEYGLERPVSESVIRAAFSSSRSIPFFTVGEDEVRAWVIREGEDALAAAGKIHSDIARGFIRGEVLAFEDLKRTGSMKAAKAENLLRLEGKEYVVKNGDIVHFRFSV